MSSDIKDELTTGDVGTVIKLTYIHYKKQNEIVAKAYKSILFKKETKFLFLRHTLHCTLYTCTLQMYCKQVAHVILKSIFQLLFLSSFTCKSSAFGNITFCY